MQMKTKSLNLPKPECKYGYTQDQIEQILETEERHQRFWEFMRGQTVVGCNGYSYNHKDGTYVKDCGVFHGGVVFAHDLERFLLGLPVID